MATEKQILANQQNSSLAGVKTDQGKCKVRFNALKHGLSASHTLAFKESFSETYETYLEILEGFTSSLVPRNFFEASLVEQMARAYFKLQRCEYMEKLCFTEDRDLFSLSIETKMETKMDSLKQIQVSRYRSQIEGQFYRAKNALLQYRSPKQLDLFCNEGDLNEPY
jgi:hypothetical protein